MSEEDILVILSIMTLFNTLYIFADYFDDRRKK